MLQALSSQVFSSNSTTHSTPSVLSLSDYLVFQKKKNLGINNSTFQKHHRCDFSRDPMAQGAMVIYLGFCNQDDLTGRFLCMQSEFLKHYRGRGGRTVKRQQVGKAMRRAESEGLLRIVPERHRNGTLNWLYFTEKAIKIIKKSKVFVVEEIASIPLIMPCTLKPTVTSYDDIAFHNDTPFPDESYDVINAFWASSQKEINLDNLARLPKAMIAEGPKSATQSGHSKGNYRDRFIVPFEILKVASRLYTQGGHAAFMKSELGLRVKQDFNRRLGLLLVKWGYKNHPSKVLDEAEDLMRDIKRRDFRNNQDYAEGLDKYFDRYGIKATRKIKSIIMREEPKVEQTPEIPAAAPEEIVEPDEIEPDEIVEVSSGASKNTISVAASFSESEVKSLRFNGMMNDWISQQQLEGIREEFERIEAFR